MINAQDIVDVSSAEESESDLRDEESDIEEDSDVKEIIYVSSDEEVILIE